MDAEPGVGAVEGRKQGQSARGAPRSAPRRGTLGVHGALLLGSGCDGHPSMVRPSEGTGSGAWASAPIRARPCTSMQVSACAAPYRGGVLKRFAARVFWTFSRWTLATEPAPTRPTVLIGAPHTSNWDFVLMLGIAWRLGIDVHWLGKKGLITERLKTLGSLAPEERKHAGRDLNILKNEIQTAIAERTVTVAASEINHQAASLFINTSIPGITARYAPLHSGLKPLSGDMKQNPENKPRWTGGFSSTKTKRDGSVKSPVL